MHMTMRRLRRPETDKPGLVQRVPLAAGLTLALLLIGCAGDADPGWTFAPPAATPTPANGEPTPANGEPTPANGEPTPGGDGVTFEVQTPPDDPLAFVPNTFTAASGAQITVNYLNDSNLPHNINFFSGPDASAPSIASTEIETGPGNMQTVTFTAPDEPGDYLFHCDVHPQPMTGTLTVQP